MINKDMMGVFVSKIDEADYMLDASRSAANKLVLEAADYLKSALGVELWHEMTKAVTSKHQRSQPHVARNTAIALEVLDGVSALGIAFDHGINHSRVYQITNNVCSLAQPKLYSTLLTLKDDNGKARKTVPVKILRDYKSLFVEGINAIVEDYERKKRGGHLTNTEIAIAEGTDALQ